MRFCILYLSITKFTGIVMKTLLGFFFIFVLFTVYLGCDSATDSKSISVAPPGLVKPYDNDSNVSLNTTFEWSGTADVIWIDINPSFSAPQIFNVTGNSYTLTSPLSPNSLYYWKAGHTVSGSTYWSANYFFFRTGAN